MTTMTGSGEPRRFSTIGLSLVRTFALPCLVAAGPILHLWSTNANSTGPASPLIALALVEGVTIVAVALLARVTGDTSRSAVTVAVVWLPLLTFGHQLDLLPGNDRDLFRWYLLAANFAVAAVLLAIVWKRQIGRIADGALIVSAAFALTTLPGIVSGLPTASAIERPPVAGTGGPDIYYIVLDGYGRADVLEELYGHDNRPFLNGLRDRGFYVADEAYSNYAVTPLSLAATLNMRYVEDIAERLKRNDDEAVFAAIHGAKVIRELRGQGYHYVHFDTIWYATASAPLADVRFSNDGLDEFGLALFNTTLVGRFVPPPTWHEVHLNTLDNLAGVAAIPESTFTFAHLMIPHPPYVFDREGNVIAHEATYDGGW